MHFFDPKRRSIFPKTCELEMKMKNYFLPSARLIKVFLLLTIIRLSQVFIGIFLFKSDPYIALYTILAFGLDMIVLNLLGIVFKPSVMFLPVKLQKVSVFFGLGIFFIYEIANVHIYQLLGTSLNIEYIAFTGRSSDILSSLRNDPPWISMVLTILLIVGLILLNKTQFIKNKVHVFQKVFLTYALFSLICFIGIAGVKAPVVPKSSLWSMGQSAVYNLFLNNSAAPVGFDFSYPTKFDASSPFLREDELKEFNSPPTLPNKREKLNVVLWVMESWTAQDLKVYGGQYNNVPNITRLLDHSLRFTRYHAASPVSIKSLFNIFCSMYPYPEFEFITSINPRIPCRSLSEVLHENGYRGSLFHAGHFSFTNKLNFFSERGIEYLADSDVMDNSSYFTYGWGIDDQAMIDEAIKWIDDNKYQPFFSVFIPITPHYPYVLPDGKKAAFPTTSLHSKYNNGIHYIDSLVGDFYRQLEERNLADNTLLIIVGDHGQAFFQHPKNRLHANYLYQENTWVPLIFINKHLFDKEIVNGRIGSHVDLAPTILDLLGLNIPRCYQGRSLVDKTPYQMVFMSTMWKDKLLGLRDGDLKYIYNLVSKEEEVYDLKSDIKEKYNIKEQYKDRLAGYRSILLRWKDSQKYLIDEYQKFYDIIQVGINPLLTA